MKKFEMCAECLAEYNDPNNRRFHAQPNACADCGPHLEIWDREGLVVASNHEALLETIEAIKRAKIVAVKGIGGFHLMVDARNEEAVEELRKRKRREAKPLAVMFPSLHAIESECMVSDVERRLLISPEAPIVLLRRRPARDLPHAIAPGNPYLGAMLPYTPLHHLVMRGLGFPVVATSGNLSDEPICIDDREALERLHGVADLFLVHDRPIVRHIDDSIVREIMGREMVLRRARGFAPLPIMSKRNLGNTLAVGAHLKNSVALASGRQLFVSQHIGDLETQPAFDAFERVVSSLEDLYEATPDEVAFDVHPDYLSTRWAKESHLRQVPVQHHYAHILSCMAENEVEAPVLGIAWDGTGYGNDGTVWGGEFLRVTSDGFERFAHLRQFRLPGGDRAAREPRRSAIGLLHEIFGGLIFESTGFPAVSTFSGTDIQLLREMLKKGLNAPITSSAGRLFDAVAAIIGLREVTRFEGQAAMELEFAAQHPQDARYKFELKTIPDKPVIVDWELMVRGIISDMTLHLSRSTISAKFHNTLVEMILDTAKLSGEKSVVLSGGCFQNRYLIERTIASLRSAGFKVYWHQRVPTNDGGICLGQATAAAIERSKADSPESARMNQVCV
jgi:hydrogenase maturation protein HypF